MTRILVAVISCWRYDYILGEHKSSAPEHTTLQSSVNARLQEIPWTQFIPQSRADVIVFRGLPPAGMNLGATDEPRGYRAVTLPVNDSYFSLTEKIQAVIKWAVAQGYDLLFKTDDDTWFNPELVLNPDAIDIPYIGQSTRTLLFKTFERTPQGRFSFSFTDDPVRRDDPQFLSFALGECYRLNRTAMDILRDAPMLDKTRTAIHDDGRPRLYSIGEDLWVGWTLAHEGIRVWNSNRHGGYETYAAEHPHVTVRLSRLLRERHPDSDESFRMTYLRACCLNFDCTMEERMKHAAEWKSVCHVPELGKTFVEESC